MRKKLNPWVEMSIKYASQRSYLDDLFHVYPTIPEGIRDIDNRLWKDVENAFKKRDKSALKRNPATADRLAGRLYEMGLDEIFAHSSEPKETNRQIGPLFKRWLRNKSLGVEPLKFDAFLKAKGNAVLDGSDAEMMAFAREHLNYRHNKGLDFIGRFNGKYVIGEAKFLTDFGGHQNAQFNDAIATVKARGVKAITVAILDGVLYIEGKNKMFKDITGRLKDENIMGALVLREFLYQV